MQRIRHTPARMSFNYFVPLSIRLVPINQPCAGPGFRVYVKASVAIESKFDKWDATGTFTSPELSTAVLDIKIQASVDMEAAQRMAS